MTVNTRWSYRVVEIKARLRAVKQEEIEALLNREGALGWELVSVSQQPGSSPLYFYFKKPA